jgi:hypothetical protein
MERSELKSAQYTNHNITLTGRRKLTVSGVDDVESFD